MKWIFIVFLSLGELSHASPHLHYFHFGVDLHIAMATVKLCCLVGSGLGPIDFLQIMSFFQLSKAFMTLDYGELLKQIE